MKRVFLQNTVKTVMTGLMATAFNCYADPPPAGSPQAKQMAPHSGFIKNATLPDAASEEFLDPFTGFVLAAGSQAQSWCCNMRDGRASLETRPAEDHGIDVFATLDAYPKLQIEAKNLEIRDGKKGEWIHFPPENIISGDAIRKTVEACLKGAGKDNGNRGTWTAETCAPPSFNIAWIEPSSGRPYCYYDGAPHSAYYDSGEKNLLASKTVNSLTDEQTGQLYSLLNIPKNWVPAEALKIPEYSLG
jgi:hypothetical protein